MSDREVESLRDASYVPIDRIAAYEKILDSRSQRLDALLKARRHVSFEEDLHDLLDQISGIADELNDNLDEYREQHRDVRKALPKLLEELDRWSRSLQASPEEPEDKVIRKLALDSVEDVRVQVKELGPMLEEYFKAHPEAAKAEKERLDRAHDPRNSPK
jgi:chromosome segregation ATPase